LVKVRQGVKEHVLRKPLLSAPIQGLEINKLIAS